jgi:hypothetical protein
MGPFAEKFPDVIAQIFIQRESITRGFIKMDQTFPEKKFTYFFPGHLLGRSTLADEKLAAKRIRLALLGRDRHLEHITDTLDVNGNGRLGRTRNSLHFGLEPVVVFDPDTVTVIGNPDQNNPARAVGKRTDLPTQI